MVIEIRKRTAEELEAVVVEQAAQLVLLQSRVRQLGKACDWLMGRCAELDAAFDPSQVDCLQGVCDAVD